MVDIVPFSAQYADDFRRLNLEWINKFELAEAADKILSDPIAGVIDVGGNIFVALDGEQAVGCAALIKLGPEKFELGKMAVASNHQGKGTGSRLLEACVNAARKEDAREIILYSSSKLKPALKMYEKFGFARVEIDGCRYKKADVKMRLSI